MTALTIVLLPGMDGTGTMFADFIAALGDDFAPLVIAYPPTERRDYADLTAHVHAHLPTGRPYILLGESFAGPIAIALAGARPAGMIGLVLCCTFARNPVPLFAPLRALVRALPVSSRLTPLIAPFLLGWHARRALRSALQCTLTMVPAEVLRYRLERVLQIDYSDRLKDIAVPVLYLQATQDRIVPASAGRHLARHCAGLQTVPLRAPHLLLQTVPLEAANAIRQFCRQF